MAMTLDEYNRLLAAGQKYVSGAQASDPAWQAWQQRASATSAENMGELPPSPSTDYWAQWHGTLTPQQSADFQQKMQELHDGRWQTKVGNVMKYAVPAAVGGAALAGTGLFGTAAQSFVGGAPLGATGAASGAAALPVFDTGVGGLFGSQAAIDTALGTTATGLGSTAGLGGTALSGLGGIVAPSLIEGGFGASSLAGAAPSLLGGSSVADLASKIGSLGGDAAKWVAANPGLVSLLGGALAGAGAGSQNTGTKPQKQYAPQPGLSMGTLQAPTLNQSPGLLTAMQQTPRANSGLARFGSQGGTWTPAAYNAQNYRWGQP